MDTIFSKNTDYKTEFKNAVTRLVAQAIEDDAEKVRKARELVDTYVSAIEDRPESRELDELSSWLVFGRKGLSVRKKIEIKAYEEAVSYRNG